MIEEKVLIDLGLSRIEAKIYLACLELGQGTVLNIARKAEIKRPTCYVSLDNLLAKGFVSKIKKRSTTLFAAENPRIILNKYKAKIADFTELLPYFEAKSIKGPKPKIRYYEGREELWKVYTQIIFPSKEIYFFGSDIEKLKKQMPDLLPFWEKRHISRNNINMEIVSTSSAGIEYAKKNKKNWPIKLMPKNLPVFADSAITENKLFIVSLDNLFGVLIESEDLAKTYKNFFLLAWQATE